MASKLTRKRAIIIIFCILFFILIMLLLPSGRLFATLGLLAKTPFDYPGSKWQCNEPAMTIQVSNDRNTSQKTSSAYLFFGKERIPISVTIDPLQSVIVVYKDNHSRIKDEKDLLIEGEIVCSTKRKMSFRVTKDNLFDGRYNIIVLRRESSG